MGLHGERVVIIGGSAGIGLATAVEAARQGAAVVIAGRSVEKLEFAKTIINSETLQTVQLDNSTEEAIEAFFAKIGPFDHLFTPGASYRLGPITTDTATAESSFKGKFWPQYFAAKHAIPYISKTGSIVLMSGAYGMRPLNAGAAYAACNGAIESLGRALAVELAPVRVNVVSPGTIGREGITDGRRLAHFEEYKNLSLLQRVGTDEEIAHSVLFLMTNRFTTGNILFPDGGYTLR
ncbi:SDR family oxidoreductase [Brevibacillus fluminis]|uniref:SDR family oxidoreductase n=1 Tax=Brevibacillus fluminis TaxID=511487 RepID=A0A3M8DWT8_9BACL|nr:SDR family oxidoreductase [Brevibacillus fluminis]RNB91761.1 SDR family oxidoreductase [Brevibacillus fluminis]